VDDGIGAYHKRGANVVMIDGTVKYLSPNTKLETLKALATINGNEKIELP
jgi:prepilin-type processing-associated H-X9-DG protein